MDTRLWAAANTLRQTSLAKKTRAAINSKLFRNLDHVNNLLYEAELAKAQI